MSSRPDVSLDLQLAIGELYAAFARPTPRVVEGCPCCITADELETLVSTPLRELDATALESYASSVMFTVGDAEDLRYFWPRLVELSLRDELQTNREIVFAKPRYAEWREWPEAEQRATERFVAAVLGEMAVTPIDGFDVDEWICGFSRMLGDVTPYLSPLLTDTPAAATNLRGFHGQNARKLARGRLGNAFWREMPTAEDKVVAWFKRPEVCAALERCDARQRHGPAGRRSDRRAHSP